MSTAESRFASIQPGEANFLRRKWLRITALVLAVLAGGTLGGGAAVYRAARHVPDFYQQKLQMPRAELVDGGTQLEQKILNLHQDVQENGAWQVVFSDDQINGWLAVDLRKKFPRLLPVGVREPRVFISDDEAHVACQYETHRTSAILSLGFDAFLTQEPNVVGIRIRAARIGAVPGLVGVAVDHITAAARRSRISLRWVQQDGDPVALVTLPQDLIETGREISLKRIEMRNGALVLAGTSRSVDESENDQVESYSATARHADSSLRTSPTLH